MQAMKEVMASNAESIKGITEVIDKVLSMVKNVKETTSNQKDKQDEFMKNISTYLVNSNSEGTCSLCANLRANFEKLSSCVNTDTVRTNQASSDEYRNILMKVDTILNEVNKSRADLLTISERNTDPGNKTPATCFNVVYSKELGVVENDHECLNVSALEGKRETFHCGNRDIRLGDAKITEVAVEGRIEVRYNNHWGTVCRALFGKREANVACRALGFARGVVENRVPEGKGQIWLYTPKCSGDEKDLFECERHIDMGIGGHKCRHFEDVGVRCFWLH